MMMVMVISTVMMMMVMVISIVMIRTNVRMSDLFLVDCPTQLILYLYLSVE